MFCKNCGKSISSDSLICQNCGMYLDKPLDTNNIGYFFLGCCIPIAGITLYFIWKEQRPKNARNCLIGFLVSIIFYILFVITYTLFLVIIIDILNQFSNYY